MQAFHRRVWRWRLQWSHGVAAAWVLGILATLVGAAAAQTPQASSAPRSPSRIRHIDLVHFSHTDYGFTDHPIVCRELQKRYIDVAIDGALATRHRAPAERFYWTAETTVAVLDWWQAASPSRREELLAAVDAGQIEVTALPLNNTPVLDAAQWAEMVHWLPEDLWKRFRPTAALQNDVNGFPRAGAMALLDRGIGRLMMGVNEDSGGVPFRRPTAWWWKMPDGRRMFVYLNYSYPMGYWFFEPVEWRHGPVPRAADTRYRPPRAGEFMGSDEASVRRCHAFLLNRLRGLEAEGYPHALLTLSITNQWRIDNDPPLLPLAAFVATWNRLKLEPTLRLTTVGAAMKRLEETIGKNIPTREGEWTDWWANGTASAPREVAASRAAKRFLAAASSGVWGPTGPAFDKTAHDILKDLCLFDEHTWGSSNSVALPDSLDTLGQFNEKAAFAFRPMARAEWLLAQRARTRLSREPEGLYVVHATAAPRSGWVSMPATALRDDYQSLEDPASGRRIKLYRAAGLRPFTAPSGPGELSPENTAATFPDRAAGQVLKFWLDAPANAKAAGTISRFLLSKQTAEAEKPARDGQPKIDVDAQGWPAGATWPGMREPLFLPGFGEFQSVGFRGFAPRWAARDVWGADDATRLRLRNEKLDIQTALAAGPAVREDNPHTITFTQPLRHPRLSWGTRVLEVWRGEPRARLTLRICRTSHEGPEVFYAAFPLPCSGVSPRTSSGGQAFVPFDDQLENTCRDYFAIDGWVQYDAPKGSWLWVSRDAPLVAFGGQQVLARRKDAPAERHRVMAMLLNNFWYTNFVGDSHGAMEFQFDLVWRDNAGARALPPAQRVADGLLEQPTVLIQPGLPEDPIFIRRLYTP
jgi:hypothetical protein